MSKRHTIQSHKQKMGQFFTTNSDLVLSGFESVVRDKVVVDPFAGGHDLIKWAARNGCSDYIAYDIEPVVEGTVKNNSIMNPPQYGKGVIVLSNPPYLAKNKHKGDKSQYDKWGQNDLYKCHLASLLSSGCEETIQILPSNFLSESRDSIRQLIFRDYDIIRATYWTEPCFDDATTGVCVVHMKRGGGGVQKFPITILPANITFEAELYKNQRYLHGKEFFDLIDNVKEIQIVKTDVGMPAPNTNIILGILDNGSKPFGLSYNEGSPIYCSPKSITTYQLTIPDYDLSELQQREICDRFQDMLGYYRAKYYGMFLANYMGANQKILSRKYANLLISYLVRDVSDKKNDLTAFFT